MVRVTERPAAPEAGLVDRGDGPTLAEERPRAMNEIVSETGRGVDHLFGVARRWWLVLVIGTLLGAGVAGLALGASTTTYVAESVVLVDQPALTSDPGQGKPTVEKLSALMDTYSRLVTSDVVLDGVRQQLGTSRSVASLRSNIRARRNPGTLTLTIEVTATTESDAAQLGEAVVAQLGPRVAELSAGSLLPDAARLVIIPLQAPEVTPVGPNASRTLLLAAVLGFGLAATAAFVLDRS